MISKNEIKEIRALAQKKFRDERGLFVVEGEKMVAEARESGFEIVKIFEKSDIGEEAMARITMLASPSPVLAVVRIPAEQPVGESVEGLTLALDGLRDPGNVGTIIRLADWFGIRHIVASQDTVDIYNPKVVQATMGSIFRVRFSYCDLPATLDKLKDKGTAIYGTFLDGENIYGADLSAATGTATGTAAGTGSAAGVIVMGSESNGISDEVAETVTKRLHIPSFAGGNRTSESLNVAIAAAITCSEFRRRM